MYSINPAVKKISGSRTKYKKLEGYIDNEDEFYIRRTLMFGYSAFPLIVHGKIRDNTIEIEYRFHTFVYIVLAWIYFLLLGGIFSHIRLNVFYQQNKFVDFSNTMLGRIIDSLLLYIIVLIIYNIEFFMINKLLNKYLLRK